MLQCEHVNIVKATYVNISTSNQVNKIRHGKR